MTLYEWNCASSVVVYQRSNLFWEAENEIQLYAIKTKTKQNKKEEEITIETHVFTLSYIHLYSYISKFYLKMARKPFNKSFFIEALKFLKL